jgi:hypothetical protein
MWMGKEEGAKVSYEWQTENIKFGSWAKMFKVELEKVYWVLFGIAHSEQIKCVI